MHFDLHSHTTLSDGVLTPAELLARARDQGVGTLAITDHDTVAGCREAPATGGIELVHGIELSTQWCGRGIHVVGLAVDIDAPALTRGIAAQRAVRNERAERIAGRLGKAGLPDLLPAALAAARDGNVARPHFARALVAAGIARDEKDAFRRWLGRGKAGDVPADWAALPTVVDWIREAGGVAVLAHPAHYRLTRTKLVALVGEFRAAGGRALEVVSGRQNGATTSRLAGIAADAGLLASCGSDFHRPGLPWTELGRFPPLPADCRPVWSLWQ